MEGIDTLVFFFFQAEDGIRDYKVTGVQTCALPISCEVDAGDVAALGEHAVEVPDGLLGQREMLVQEAAAILLGEKAVEAPEAVVARADVQQVHHQQVAGLGALDAHGAGQEVDGGQVHVAHVFGAVVVLDGAAGPVIGLQLELRARLHPDRHRSEEHTSELQSPCNLVCRLLLEKKKTESSRAPSAVPSSARCRSRCSS